MTERSWPRQLDPDGYTALPLPLWCCLLLLSRCYWLVLMALASRAQSADLLALFYPDPQQLYLALVLARPAAFEYVLVHELCHLLQANHSTRFWREVEARFPSWEDERDYLRREGRALKGRLRRLLAG